MDNEVSGEWLFVWLVSSGAPLWGGGILTVLIGLKLQNILGA
ncbi:hypothetical protein V3564_05370 [Bartonella sp. B12(2025)]